MKRFYSQVSVEDGESGFRVLLDSRPMRTPAKAVLTLPTGPLAEAIAAEWREVPDKAEIVVAHLGLTRLAATGLDRVGSQRESVVADTAKYAASDLLCYRAGEPASLVQRQHETWQPLLDWAAERYEAPLRVACGVSLVDQPPASLARLRSAVAAYGDLALAALYNLTHGAGSLVIALAVADGRLAPAQAFAAAQLDELYQIERWGDDPIAQERHRGLLADFETAGRFLALLEDRRLGG